MSKDLRYGLLTEVEVVFYNAVKAALDENPYDNAEEKRLGDLLEEVLHRLRLSRYVVRTSGRVRPQLTRKARLPACNVCGAQPGAQCVATCAQQGHPSLASEDLRTRNNGRPVDALGRPVKYIEFGIFDALGNCLDQGFDSYEKAEHVRARRYKEAHVGMIKVAEISR